MLYSIDNLKPITSVPHEESFIRWKAKIDPLKYEAIKNELRGRLTESEVHTSSWMPGSNWMGTVFEPIYIEACSLNQEAAALFFGLILWEVMMEDEHDWSFGRYSVGNVPIEGMTYFRIQRRDR